MALVAGGVLGRALYSSSTCLFTRASLRHSPLPGVFISSFHRPHARRLFVAGLALALLSGCGTGPASEAAPEVVAEATQQASPATAKATPSTKPTPSPSPTPSDVAPLDSETVAEVPGTPRAPSDQPAANTTALALLETLPVKGRAPKTGYDREQFGQAWADVDRNGCDTRNDMLNRDLTDIVHASSVPCKVQSGLLDDPYTGTEIPFLRGQTTSSDVQIDHVVALSDAWQKGAQQLTAGQRLAFANDPLNLQSTDGPTNQQKSDGDAATWLPPNKGYRCEYVARQVSVKATYTLWVTQAEHDAMVRVLSDCTGILAPTNQVAPSVATPVEPAPTEAPAPAPVVEPVAPAPAPVVPEAVAPPVVVPAPVAPAPVAPAPASYANCAAVRAAGAAPIHAGTPGFSPTFDGDGDGVGCE